VNLTTAPVAVDVVVVAVFVDVVVAVDIAVGKSKPSRHVDGSTWGFILPVS